MTLLVELCETEKFFQSTAETLLDRSNQEAVYLMLNKWQKYIPQNRKSQLIMILFTYCLKHELLDQAVKLLRQNTVHLGESAKQKTYNFMADLFSRPFYMKQKYKLAFQYSQHSAALAYALDKLDPNQVLSGNLHGINSLMLVLDLLRNLIKTAPAFRLSHDIY